MMAPQQKQWTVAHLNDEEPDAVPYLQDWDDCSTLASSASIRGFARLTTILRNGGEPSEIIIRVERKLSLSGRAVRKLLKMIQSILSRISRQQQESCSASQASEFQPSLGVNGVIV